MSPVALSIRCAGARVLLGAAKLCIRVGASVRRNPLAPTAAVLSLHRTARWFGHAALHLIGEPERFCVSARADLARPLDLSAGWIARRDGHGDDDPGRGRAEDPPSEAPPRARTGLQRWLAGYGFLWASSVALGVAPAAASGPLAAVTLGGFAGAAILSAGTAALSSRHRRPMLTPPALGLLGLTFVTIALLARHQTPLVVLGAGNCSIAWRVLFVSVRRDRRGDP